MYLARGHYPHLRPLASFLECPTVTPNGRLIDQPGYDSDTGLYLAFGRSGYGTTTCPTEQGRRCGRRWSSSGAGR